MMSTMISGVCIDRLGRRLMVDGEAVRLTRLEFDLLGFLELRPGIAFSREDLLRQVWGYDVWQGGTRTVDVHVRRIRDKLGTYAGHLKTSQGYGYLWEES